MKIKVSDLTENDLAKIKSINIQKAKSLYNSMPFVTKVYMAMKTKLPFDFIKDNWKEITGDGIE